MGHIFLRPASSSRPLATIVTGYVEIPDHTRSKEEYMALGAKLAKCNIPILFFEDRLEECWLHKYIKDTGREYTHSVSNNPEKNSLNYHIVQAQKSEWLVRALDSLPTFGMPNVIVWMDLGIMQFPDITKEIIEDFIYRAAFEQAIAIPGCWHKDYTYIDEHPCWRFCGGIVVMPCKYAVTFDNAMKAEYKCWMKRTGNVSWEVNTMARVEQRMPTMPIRHYYADHNNTLLVNY